MDRLWLLSGGIVLLASVLNTLLVSRGLPPHVNYDSTVFFDHDKLISPSSREELVSMVTAAATGGRRVRVLGAGHSWSEVAQSDDLVLSLHNYRGLVRVDAASKTATFKAGTTLHEVNAALEEHGLAMTNLGSISDQTIAGAISTGTHGTGIGFGNLATLVTGMELITATGEVLQLSQDDKDTDIFKAAQVSVGMLGVISEVSIQCEDSFNLEETLSNHPLEDCLDNLEGLANSAQHVKLWMEYHSGSCILFQVNRTSEAPRGIPNDWMVAIKNYFFESVLLLSSWWPSASPALLKAIFFIPPFPAHNRVDKSYEVFNIRPDYSRQYPVHCESELAVAVTDCAEAIRAVKRVIHELGIPKNHPTEVRFVRGDDIWLSPDYHRDTCRITETIYNPSLETKDHFFNAIFNATRQFSPRLHWGKSFNFTPNDARSMYPMLGAFAKVRKQLDPRGIFLSNKLENSLGFD